MQGVQVNILEAEFSAFWAAYPKKKSKGDAYRAWLQTKSRRPELSVILKALVVLKESEDWLRDGGQWIPYPATWLRAWGWADVAEEDKAAVVGDKLWWKTNAGIESKAREVGLEWDALHGESWMDFVARLKDVVKKQPVQLRQA
jgi:hypothetical protein